MPAQRISAPAPALPAAPRFALSHEQSTQGTANGLKTLVMNVIEFFLSPEAVARRRIVKASLTGAESLNLSCMRLKRLPQEIGSLTRLHVLHLWRNQLTSLPPQIGRCAQLEELYLSDNQLASLPDSLQHLTHLKRLFLHGNPRLHLPNRLLGPKWEVVMSSRSAPASPKAILEHYFHRHSL